MQQSIRRAGGWLPFDRFMALALYAPGLGYYANSSRQFGTMPSSGSDFVTAPEMSPLFGQALAAQVAEALQVTGTDEIWEFGAGSGALALQLLQALGRRVRRYTIVDLSGTLRERQQHRLAALAHQVEWASELPQAMRGVVVGNEVLDAMPVKLLARIGGRWHERGVVLRDTARAGRARRPGLGGPADRPAAAGGDRRRARLPHRDSSAGGGVHPHPGRPAGARGGLLHRLRFSGRRVLPSPARHGHADVPPRAHGRRRPPGRPGPARTSRRT